MKVGELAPRPDQVVRTEEEIISSWVGPVGQPLVSVSCATFNHAAYIRDAIHGLLIQETTFPFNIVIHDDASNDGTAEIVREYENSYPKIIKGVYQERNLFSRGIPRDSYIKPFLLGKYIAVCEGDDYWTDPKKLQIQVSFLEGNPDYVISGHDAFILNSDRRIVSVSKLAGSQKKDFEPAALISERPWILTMSRVYRNIDLPAPIERRFILNYDTFFISLIGWHGKSKYHPEIQPSGYRRHGGGVWSMSGAQDKRAALISSHLWIARYYRRVGEPEVAAAFEREALQRMLRSVKPQNLVLLVPSKILLREVVARTRGFLYRKIKSFLGKLH